MWNHSVHDAELSLVRRATVTAINIIGEGVLMNYPSSDVQADDQHSA